MHKAKADNMKSRHCPVGIKTAELKPPGFNLTGQIVDKTHQIFNSIPDNKDGEQIGNIIDDAYQISFTGFQIYEKIVSANPLVCGK